MTSIEDTSLAGQLAFPFLFKPGRLDALHIKFLDGLASFLIPRGIYTMEELFVLSPVSYFSLLFPRILFFTFFFLPHPHTTWRVCFAAGH